MLEPVCAVYETFAQQTTPNFASDLVKLARLTDHPQLFQQTVGWRPEVKVGLGYR